MFSYKINIFLEAMDKKGMLLSISNIILRYLKIMCYINNSFNVKDYTKKKKKKYLFYFRNLS